MFVHCENMIDQGEFTFVAIWNKDQDDYEDIVDSLVDLARTEIHKYLDTEEDVEIKCSLMDLYDKLVQGLRDEDKKIVIYEDENKAEYQWKFKGIIDEYANLLKERHSEIDKSVKVEDLSWVLDLAKYKHNQEFLELLDLIHEAITNAEDGSISEYQMNLIIGYLYRNPIDVEITDEELKIRFDNWLDENLANYIK